MKFKIVEDNTPSPWEDEGVKQTHPYILFVRKWNLFLPYYVYIKRFSTRNDAHAYAIEYSKWPSNKNEYFNY